jgi:membrane protease YdiL (CAAX protease family)
LFSLWHGYGLLGSLEVAIGGYLLARLYAYTGSLLPCMIVHSCMNLLPLLYGLAARA